MRCAPYQPPVNSTFLSEQISHQQPVGSIFLSEQISISHQPNEQAALGVINAMHPLPSFLWVHSYLLQEETRLDRSHKFEATNSLLTAGAPAVSSGAAAAALVTTNSSGAAKPPSTTSASSPPKGGDRHKKRKQSDGRPRNNSGSTPQTSAPQPQIWGSFTMDHGPVWMMG
jgi:hypothetical protein